jgi:hypothetical protein
MSKMVVKPIHREKKIINKPFSLKRFTLKPPYKRTIAERKLIRTNPWGDKDGDAVPNWIDCKPFDRRRQGLSKRDLDNKRKDIKFYEKYKDGKPIEKKDLELADFRSDDDDEYAVDAEMKKKYINNEDMKEQLREIIKESGGKYGSLSRLAAQDPPIKHKIAYESDDDEYEEEAEGSKKSKGGQDK